MTLDPQVFQRYVSSQLADAEDVEVRGVERIHGGAARETYRLRLASRRPGERAGAPPCGIPEEG